MRSHFLHTVLGLTVLGSALVACGADGADGAGGAGGAGTGGDTSASTSGVPAVTGTQAGPTTTTTTTTGGPVAQSSGSGGECTAVVFGEPFDTCGQTYCCDEMTLCEGDPTLCFDAGNALDTSLPGGAAIYECLYVDGGCFGGRICESNITFGEALDPTDPEDAATLEFAYCLDQACCEEMSFCTSAGEDVESCISCLNDDPHGELCDPVNRCSSGNCDGALFLYDICDSGLGSVNSEISACLSENCCADYVACTGGVDGAGDPNDPGQLDACLDCFAAGGGPECDDVITCEEENCNTQICDSGVTIGDLVLAACLTASCCTEYQDCTNDGADADACITCFNSADGGPLCDAAIQCETDNCGGGEGGGGTGGGGTGGI